MSQQRQFTHAPMVRERVPLLVGLAGPSGSGKTYSALRLAAGMQRVTGGEVFGIDTESRRMAHYADKFRVQHVPFAAPFSPLDYLAAIDHCVKSGATTVIIDSMSHEHEGPGGVLELHDREVERMAGNDFAKRERVKFAGWIEPKRQRQRLINTVLQMGVNAIMCFRAKEKTKPVPGGQPLELGWTPIAGDEIVYEMTLGCLLPPNSGGVPIWNVSKPGERLMMKLPDQFRALFETPRPLDEEIGQALAEWAAGDVETPSAEELAEVLRELDQAPDTDALRAAAEKHSRRPWSVEQRGQIRAAITTRREALTKE